MLPADIARCRGTDAPECRDCLRRLALEHDRETNALQSWLIQPQPQPCEYRLTGGRTEHKQE